MEAHETVVDEIRAQARALESAPGFPAPLAEQARKATGWMGAGEAAFDDVRFSAELLSLQAARHLEPPAITGGGSRRLVKLAVRALVGWYGRFLCQHLGALGQAFARLGRAVADRIDRLEDDDAGDRRALRAELDDLAARVAALEAAPSTGQPRGGDVPGEAAPSTS